VSHRDARPIWGEIDLAAITHNVGLLRECARRPVKILAPVKANAYGHGMAAVSLHLQNLGVEGLATANFDDAVAARRAGVTIPILLYGAQLPSGHADVLDHGLTPSVYDHESLRVLAELGSARTKPVPVHIKVDAGLGRLGVRLDEAAAFAREVLQQPGLFLEGIYTHIPFSDDQTGAWSQRRLAAFTALVREVQVSHGIAIPYAQGAASSVMSQDFPDELNTIAPGHLVFGLSPISGLRAESLGFRKALRALKANLIHIGHRRRGDDLIGSPPGGLTSDATTGVILFGMDNGFRPAAAGQTAVMLCHGKRCPVLSVSAEYAVIDVSHLEHPRVGDEVTIIGTDGPDAIAVEDVALWQGAPSAAYWQVALRNVPFAAV
jgi:alanine racemase